MQTELQQRTERIADREEILELVRRERFARDQRHFDVMRDCFHDDAHIRTSWFDGGAADYVKASADRADLSPNSKHWVFPGFVRTEAERATVESPAMIFNCFPLDGVEVQMQVYCRFFSRVTRSGGVWRLSSFEVLFEHDTLRTVDPRQVLPVDWDVLAGYRFSYRFLTHVQSSRGYRVNPDLYGDDRRPQLLGFMAEQDRWLAGATCGGAA